MIPAVLYWLVGLGLVLVAASALALRSHTRFAARARGAHVTALPRGGRATPLDRLLDSEEARHPGAQGLANLIAPEDAFAARSLSAAEAGRSLDLIYYIWSTDTSGWLLIADLLAAADRGVRVRLLLDDVNMAGLDLAFLGLNQHPNIEVRLFNPIRNRGHRLRRAIEFALGLSRFNRRIHSKVWIADGRLAILGGRNIGDTYFGAPGGRVRRSHDADVLLAGPKVVEVEAAFDAYWNLALSLPIVTLWPNFRISMKRFRRRVARHTRSDAAQAFRAAALAGRSSAGLLRDRLRWTPEVEVLADPPEKAFGQREDGWLRDRLDRLMRTARHDVRLVTPYFVPGSQGMQALTGLAARGVRLSVMTNALAATDYLTVYGAYSHYRPVLLAAGARLYEFAPPRDEQGKRELLHAKIFLIDGQKAVVGSHNFDLRSSNINIEIGLLFAEPELVAELEAEFDRLSGPALSHQVTLQGRSLRWRDARLDGVEVLRAEPEANLSRRLVAWTMRRMPHGFF